MLIGSLAMNVGGHEYEKIFNHIATLLFSICTYGSIIRLVNTTPHALLVTFSGVGCFGIELGLTLVCESGTIPAIGNTTFQYNYNWGVTKTWVNIGIHPAHWGGDQWTHPCTRESLIS